MTKELVISSNRHETKVAILEDEQLVEVYFQRSNEYSLVGFDPQGARDAGVARHAIGLCESGPGARRVPVCIGFP